MCTVWSAQKFQRCHMTVADVSRVVRLIKMLTVVSKATVISMVIVSTM
jgi:hypothetical protein